MSWVISEHLQCSYYERLPSMVGRQNRAGWCWTVGSRRNDAMSATYCLPLPAQHHFHKTDCTLISVYLPFSSSVVPCPLAKLFHVFIKVVVWKVIISNACIIHSCYMDLKSFTWTFQSCNFCPLLNQTKLLFEQSLQIPRGHRPKSYP